MSSHITISVWSKCRVRNLLFHGTYIIKRTKNSLSHFPSITDLQLRDGDSFSNLWNLCSVQGMTRNPSYAHRSQLGNNIYMIHIYIFIYNRYINILYIFTYYCQFNSLDNCIFLHQLSILNNMYIYQCNYFYTSKLIQSLLFNLSTYLSYNHLMLKFA